LNIVECDIYPGFEKILAEKGRKEAMQSGKNCAMALVRNAPSFQGSLHCDEVVTAVNPTRG